jgi:hypothetical protein
MNFLIDKNFLLMIKSRFKVENFGVFSKIKVALIMIELVNEVFIYFRT